MDQLQDRIPGETAACGAWATTAHAPPPTAGVMARAVEVPHALNELGFESSRRRVMRPRRREPRQEGQ